MGIPPQKKNIEQIQKDWFEENAPLGKELGYPECCIKEFCNDAPEFLKENAPHEMHRLRYRASFRNGEYTGFIPCEYHAKKILSGEMEIENLIHGRNPDFPVFPMYAQQ